MKILVFGSCLLLLAGLVGSVAVDSAHAARSSKPKEIVVVGSKVKDVVRSAGLTATDDLLGALNRDIHKMIQRAAQRAKANGRKTIRSYDLACLPRTTNRDLIVMSGRMRSVIGSAGLRSDGELVQAVSDKVHEILEDAIHRCTSNGRSTVRPYDL